MAVVPSRQKMTWMNNRSSAYTVKGGWPNSAFRSTCWGSRSTVAVHRTMSSSVTRSAKRLSASMDVAMSGKATSS